MERFRWQRSRVARQHAPLLKPGPFIPAVLSIFLINPSPESKKISHHSLHRIRNAKR
jgi:hypothetical protein